MPSFTFIASVLGTPDPRGLARFYRHVLGWPIRDDTDEWATLRPADGSTGLSFQLERDHVPPVWPPVGPADQQMQLHLEIEVDDLAAASAHAEACGAPVSACQPQDDVRVHVDPAGHPFCLYTT